MPVALIIQCNASNQRETNVRIIVLKSCLINTVVLQIFDIRRVFVGTDKALFEIFH